MVGFSSLRSVEDIETESEAGHAAHDEGFSSLRSVEDIETRRATQRVHMPYPELQFTSIRRGY